MSFLVVLRHSFVDSLVTRVKHHNADSRIDTNLVLVTA